MNWNSSFHLGSLVFLTTFVFFSSPLKRTTAYGLVPRFPSTFSAPSSSTCNTPPPDKMPLLELALPSPSSGVSLVLLLSSLKGSNVNSTTSFPLFFLFCVSFGFVLLRRSSANSLLSCGVSRRRGTTCMPNLSCILTCTTRNGVINLRLPLIMQIRKIRKDGKPFPNQTYGAQGPVFQDP
jgi:hypothetical protein